MSTSSAALAACFARSYADARAKFIAAARERGLEPAAATLPDRRGSEGEELAIDSVLLGPLDAPQLLMLSSGVHGVEGFCGSGCQLALLRDRELMARVDAGAHAILLIHALNPYGFSHLRRTNEDNVDLNRNFIDFDAPPDNPGYAALHPILFPARRPALSDPLSLARLGLSTARHGLPTMQAAVSSGQYTHPSGLFFGGHEPSFSNLELRALLRRHVRPRSRMLWLDLHTGLGRRGACEKMLVASDEPAMQPIARAIWGPPITRLGDGSSASAPLSGTPLRALERECPDVDHVSLTLEYGTSPLLTVFAALAREQWHSNNPDAPGLARARARLRDVFYVDTPRWRAQVWRSCRAAIVDALDAMDARARLGPMV